MNQRSISGRSAALFGSLILASLLTACGGGIEEEGASTSTTVDLPAATVPTTNDAAQAPGTPPVAQSPVEQPPSAQIPVAEPPVAQSPVSPPPVQQAPVIASALLSWQPPTTNTDGSSLSRLAGYRIYYGTNANALTRVIDVTNPGLTSYTVGDLTSGTYYFAVSAYTTDGVEGDKSTVGSKTIS
jgi:hypothetical protein